MDSLRNFLSGPTGILVILLLGLPFVFLGTGSLGTGFTGSFGSINGEDVTETDVALASSSAVQRFQSIYGEDFDFNLLDEDFKNQSIISFKTKFFCVIFESFWRFHYWLK